MDSPILTLNDGNRMPQLGFGVWQIPQDTTAATVIEALEAGYRLIDTATAYGNEAGVGAALKSGVVPREDVFVTTKLANPDQGYDAAMTAFDKSLDLLGIDVVDLYLIHWPCPAAGRYVETWRALKQIKDDGRTKSIGVSNFMPEHLQRLFDEVGMVPAVNQIEVHPRFQQAAQRAFDAKHSIVTQSWSPLGRGRLTEIPEIAAIATKHGRSWAQVVLRWHLDLGLSVVTRSSNPARIRENYASLDFKLDGDDMRRLVTLDDPAGRAGPHPDRMGA